MKKDNFEAILIFSMILRRYLVLLSLITVIVTMVGCSATKYVPDGEMLLNKVSITGDLGACNSDQLMDYVRQQPNVRVLGLWRVNLGLYNMSKPKDNWFNNTYFNFNNNSY
mgnify:FL=1